MIQLLFAGVFLITVFPVLLRLCLTAENSEARLVRFGLAGRLIPAIFLALIGIVQLNWLPDVTALNVFRLINSAIFFIIETPMHEFGHFALMPLGKMASIFGGSLMEVLIPGALFAFFLSKRCPLLSSYMLFFVGRNLIYIAWYMSTARVRENFLALSIDQNPDMHDWFQLFSAWGVLEQDRTIAMVTRAGGIGVMIISLIFMLFLSKQSGEQSSAREVIAANPAQNL